MSLRTANSCPDFDMEVKIWTALGIGEAHRRGVPERSGGMITSESPTAACGGNSQIKRLSHMPNIGGIIKLPYKSLQLAIIKNKRYICVYMHRIR